MPIFMVKQEKSVRKKRGRPAGRRYRQTIPVRLSDDTVAAIDAWIDQQRETMSRTEAIRRFIERGLTAEPAPRKPKATK
jgi:cytochrome c553